MIPCGLPGDLGECEFTRKVRCPGSRLNVSDKHILQREWMNGVGCKQLSKSLRTTVVGAIHL